MLYTMLDGRIAFWTYRSSQKALNIARDPRVTWDHRKLLPPAG